MRHNLKMVPLSDQQGTGVPACRRCPVDADYEPLEAGRQGRYFSLLRNARQLWATLTENTHSSRHG